MPSWPASLPQPVGQSLNVAPRENVIVASGDVGPPITRRRYTSRLIDYSAQLFLNETERRVLDNFHHGDCEDGNLSFTMDDWINGGGEATFKWIAPPQYSQAGPSGYWYVNIAFVKTA